MHEKFIYLPNKVGIPELRLVARCCLHLSLVVEEIQARLAVLPNLAVTALVPPTSSRVTLSSSSFLVTLGVICDFNHGTKTFNPEDRA